MAEGTATFPTDGSEKGVGPFDGSNFFHFRIDNTTAKNLAVAARDSTGVHLFSVAAALSDAFSNPTVGGIGAYGLVWDGTNWRRLKADTSSNLLVKAASNTGVDIGDVDILSVVPGVSATSLGKAEDAVHVTGDTGVFILGVRSDAGGSLVSTDGDYSPFSLDTNGALRVTGGGGTQYQEDNPHTTGNTGTMALAVRNDAGTALAGTDGDYIPLTVNANGALYVTGGTEFAEDSVHVSGHLGRMSLAVRNDAGTPLGADGDYVPFTVNASGALYTTGGGTQYAEDAIHASGNTGTLALVVRNDAGTALAADGDYNALIVNSVGHLWTAATQTGTWTVQPGNTPNTAPWLMAGQAAHDAAIAANPFRIGARAVTSTYTAVATGDQADLISDTLGRLVALPFSILENVTSGITAAITGTSDTQVIPAAGAGVRLYITSITVTNNHPTVSTLVEIKDGSTVKYRAYAGSDGGGFVISFPTPIPCTANTDVNAANVTTGANTYVSMTAFKSSV